MDKPPRFTIVTVCFNAVATIAETASSLASQRCKDYEWLVVDGASRDATLVVVEAAGIAQRRVISEPDHGIYDAMNKAVSLARGDWIYFLNSGDAFADDDVLSDITAATDANPQTKLVWGDMIYVDGQRERRRSFAHVRRSTLVFDDLNHQAVFARRQLFQQLGGFELRFRTSADYDWLLRVMGAGVAVRHVRRVIARFAVGGMHSSSPQALVDERRQLRMQYVTRRQLQIGEAIAKWRRRYRLLRGHGG